MLSPRLTFRYGMMLGISTVAVLAATGCGGTSGTGGEQCVYGDHTYDRDERFPADDGCNTCICGADGRTSCTLLACETCDDLLTRYSAAIDETKTCDAQQIGQCSELITEGLACGCQTFVSAAKSDAIAAASAAQQQYSAMSCGGGVVCGPCRAPTAAFCSSEGRCEQLFEDGDAACKVNGVIYKSGTSGIADPVSCNQCQCQDGQLACTEVGCPIPCPTGTAYGTQCAQCGPTDACDVVEYGCLPTCSDTCAQGVCIDHVCKTVCG